MQYATSVPFRGDIAKSFSLAEAALTAVGFRLAERKEESLVVIGPGMRSSRESALVGASRIHIFGGKGGLALEADLGGVQTLARFVTLFPPGLCLTLGILFAVVFSMVHGPGDWIIGLALGIGVMTLLWLVLGPWMARVFYRRTCHGLDALLANMVAVGESAEPDAAG